MEGAGELFKARGAQLYLVEGDESVLMQSGQFALMLVKNPVSQLAAVVAIVGEVQWPVGRDSCVLREDEGSFTFTLPGPLTYNLVLPSDSADLQRLEHILREYSDCQQKPSAAEEQKQDKESTHGKELIPSSDSRKRASDITHSRMMGRMLRARRMSAVAKVFSKSLERGAINAASHVEPMDTIAPPRQILSSLALTSVDAVAKVVDAVETGGRTLLEMAGSAAAGVPSEEQKHKQDTSSDSTLSNLINSGWTLNKLGLLMLFRWVITASMAIHSGGSSSGGSSRSGSSSSSQFRRLLSSSSSSSSFSTKSPATPSHVQGAAATADVMNTALSLQPPAPTGTSMSSASLVPPPPPLFSQQAPRVRHSHMPPPSGPPPLMAAGAPPQTAIVIAASDSPTSTPFHVYKPRPTPAAPITTAPPLPHSLPHRPRFQPSPKS